MECIKPIRFLSNKEIKKSAETAYASLNRENIFPVPIDNIIEGMGFIIIPIHRLKMDMGIDAFINKRKELYIDYDSYMSNSYRYRFSMAHELGHFFLHSDIFNDIDDIPSFINFYNSTSPNVLDMIESQANTFASFFLCPYNHVKDAIQKFIIEPMIKAKITKDKTFIADAANYKIDAIAKYFMVSSQAMSIRLSKFFDKNI